VVRTAHASSRAVRSIFAVIGFLIAGGASGLALRAGQAQPAPRPPCASASVLADLLNRSFAAYNAREATEGLLLLRQAFDRATADNCPVERAEALRRLAIADAFALRYDDARTKLNEALSLFRQYGVRRGEAQTLGQIGASLVASGRREEAVAPLRQALGLARTLGDDSIAAAAYENLVYALPASVEKDRLRTEALALARSSPTLRSTACAILHQWADEQFGLGRYDAAFATTRETIGCYQEVGDNGRLGRTYVSLGRLYRAHGRLDLALEQYEHALTLQRAAGDQLSAVQSLNAIAVTYGYMGRYDEALQRLTEALDLARQLRSDRNVEFLRGNIAGIYIGLGRYREAASTLEETVAIASQRWDQPVRLTQLSGAYVGLGLKARALETADEAVRLSTTLTPDERAMVFSARARALQELGRFEEASADLKQALAAVEDLRLHTLPDDFLKRGFGQRYQWVSATSVSLLQAQGRAREGLETAERARARAFLDLLASRRQSSSAQADAAGGRAAPAAFPEMVTAARRLDSTLVAYWVGEAETFVWIVRPDGRLASARIAITSAQLTSMVQDATGAGRPAGGLLIGGGSSARPWRALYRTLFGPVREHLPTAAGSRLTIVPHGPLFGVPFAALRDASDRYLVETYEIHYVPAIGVLSYVSQPRRERSVSALLVGDPGPDAARDGVLALPPLPWAQREVDAIAKLLPSPPTRLTGRDATETRVRESLAGKSLLHFATHGIVQNEERLSSYLALAGTPTASGDDGRLTANETYDLHLDADLIVLSGCRTALGPILGDGVIGFTRAFLAAGASSVVATMWDIPDRTSFEVMQGFYQAWVTAPARAGRNGRSLRQSQLQVLRALRAGMISSNGVVLPESPRLWAGYVLVGEP
jgi:CHAT domain-containing protein/tetratricopeptide (TPR) repeat protein